MGSPRLNVPTGATTEFVTSFMPQRMLATCIRILSSPSRFFASVWRHDYSGVATPTAFLVASVSLAAALSNFVPPFDGETRWIDVIMSLDRSRAVRVLSLLGIRGADFEKMGMAEKLTPDRSSRSDEIRRLVGSVRVESILMYLAAKDRDLAGDFAEAFRRTSTRKRIVSNFTAVNLALSLFLAAWFMHLILRTGTQLYRTGLYTLFYLRGLWAFLGVAIVAAGVQIMPYDWPSRASFAATIYASILCVVVLQCVWAYRKIYEQSTLRTLSAVIVGKVTSILSVIALRAIVTVAADQWLQITSTG